MSVAATKAKARTRRPSWADRRNRLLADYFPLVDSLHEVIWLQREAAGAEARRLERHERAYTARVHGLWDEYVAGTPVVPLSRCPFTDAVVQYSIDHLGLDGLWWAYDAPARRIQQLPPTAFAQTGAVRLGGPPKPAPFLCKPGPEVPHVIPRLLEHPAMMAVLSSIPIADHQGYAVFYYASPVPVRLPRANVWGTNEYWFHDESGEERWGEVVEDEADLDFDLQPWLDRGRLQWIAPGDETLTLRSGSAGCPYVGLEGRRRILRIQRGEVWTTEVL